MNKEVDISVIVSVYNVELYLKDCLDSIVKQDYHNFEVICVNDGSSDCSLSILEKYEKNYSFIYVYTKANGGLSSARNYGLEKANGKYIFFLDSDDMLADESCLSFMVKNMEQYSLDALYFDGKSFFENESLRRNNPNFEEAYIRKKSYGYYRKGLELFADFVDDGVYYAQTALQCIKRKFINENKLRYVDGLLYEDNLFTFTAMMLAGKVMHHKRTVLLHRVRSGSIMQSKPSFHGFYSLFYTHRETLRFYMDRIEKGYIDTEVSKRLNALRNEARIVYRGLDDEERVKLSTLPEDEQYVIKTMFLPSLLISGESYYFPYHLFHMGSRIVIYGAGTVGKQFYYRALQDAKVNIVGIVDINAAKFQEGVIPILPVSMLKQLDYDYILIAVENDDIAHEIEKNLIEMDIPEYKIKWDGQVYLKDKYDRKSYEYRKFSHRLMQSVRKRFFLFGLPEHGNMGDYAIGIAEKQFFDDYFSEYELIRVAGNEWLELKSYFIANIKRTDVIFITGGGFIGNMWASGSTSMDIAQAFPDNLKIFLPNTLTYYDIQKESLVRDDLEKLCADHHTYLFFREKKSFNLCRDLGFGDWCYCFPDMVLYLQHNIQGKQRKGKVLLCFRTDAEKIFQEQDNLKRLLTCNQIPYDEKDIHLYKYVPENESGLYITHLIQEFAEYDMVITDRLHGMLLSYMSKTPCAAFDNATHKVAGVYEWIKAEPEIEFFEKYEEDNLLNFINEYKGKKVTGCQKEQLSSQFELLHRTINKLVLSDTEVGV